MEAVTNPLDLLLALSGAAISFFMFGCIYQVLKAGRIERRPPFPPVSNAYKPGVYWGSILFIALGACLTMWGSVVFFFEAFGR